MLSRRTSIDKLLAGPALSFGEEEEEEEEEELPPPARSLAPAWAPRERPLSEMLLLSHLSAPRSAAFAALHAATTMPRTSSGPSRCATRALPRSSGAAWKRLAWRSASRLCASMRQPCVANIMSYAITFSSLLINPISAEEEEE